MRTAQSDRLLWVDIARGIGIVLVVYAHVLRGHFPLQGMDDWPAQHDRVIYAFHMPLFFLIAGLFLWQSLERDRQRFIKGRWWQIAYPYILWSLITAAIELAAAPYVNSPLTLHEMLLIPVIPIEQYWFLYALLIHQLVIAAIYPFKQLLPVVVLAGLALVAVAGGTLIQVRAFNFLPYVVAGIFAAKGLQAAAQGHLAAQLARALGGFARLALLLEPATATNASIFVVLLAGLAGTIGTIGSAMLLARTPAARLLALLGEASLAIFLAHTIFSAGTRIALKLVGVPAASPVSLFAATLVGLAAPLVLFVWARQHGHARLLGFGGPPRRAESTA